MEIYFNDLTKDAQTRLLKEAGVKGPEEMNWNVFPVTEVDFDSVESVPEQEEAEKSEEKEFWVSMKVDGRYHTPVRATFVKDTDGLPYMVQGTEKMEHKKGGKPMFKTKYIIQKLAFPVDGVYTHLVQRWTSVDGRPYAYCGFGRYCKSEEEAVAYRDNAEKEDAYAKRPKQEVKAIPDGAYYFLDCMNAFANEGLFPVTEFSGDEEAKQTAANYEATLYRYEYKAGIRISSTILYQPACA